MEINSISAVSDKSEENGNTKVSKFRNYSSQIYAASATNILKFTVGSTIGLTTVLIGELHKEDAEIKMSNSEVSLFSSHCFMAPIGCLAWGLVAQRIGNRAVMLTAMVFCTVTFSMFYFATESTMLLAAQSLVGLVSMVTVGPGITYVVEITQPQLRSALTASTTLTTMSAAFLIVLLSNFLHWRTIVLVMLAFPITAFVAVFTIPESPHWLASKNKFDKAKAALSWLRGWTAPENVVSEFNDLKKPYEKSSGNSFKENMRTYWHRSFYHPLTLMCLLFTLHQCTGYGVLVPYSIVVFKQINAPIDPHVAASIFDAMRIFGAVGCILFINYAGKKKLTYISLLGCALTFFTSSTTLLLSEYQFYPEICRWIATISMMFTTFLASSGIDKIVYILNAELFPTKYRNFGSGIGLFVATIASAIANKIFLFMMDVLTLPGVFLTFGISCIVTCTFFHFAFLDTDGKTLQEIEEHYGANKKLVKQGKAAKVLTEAESV